MTLHEYIQNEILPRYAAFDKGHRRDHAESVIAESAKLVEKINSERNNPNHHAQQPMMRYPIDDQPINAEMAYVIAAYHDLGLSVDREFHHIHSGEILMADERLREWFSPEQLLIMKEAIEDHRASGKNPPRTIYGAIVAEADRQIEPETILRRSFFFGQKLRPEADFDWLFERAYDHMLEKYAEGGYMRLWLNSERNVQGLEALRKIIRDKEYMRQLCLDIWNKQ